MDHLVQYIYDSYIRGTVWTAGTAGIQVNLFPKECLSYIFRLGQQKGLEIGTGHEAGESPSPALVFQGKLIIQEKQLRFIK